MLEIKWGVRPEERGEKSDNMSIFYRLWYTDSGNCYTHKDFENKEKAIEEALKIRNALIEYVGNDCNIKLEKHIVEQIDLED